jgi:archaemetzincin
VSDRATEPLWLVPINGSKPAVVGALARDLAHLLRVRTGVRTWPVDIAWALDPSRGQYEARRLLELLAALPEPGWVLGVTDVDLFQPVLTFVIGEAYLDGRAAVVSTYRLSEERVGLPPDPELLYQRLLKEAVHEIGHCWGLVHCRNPDCVMYASAVAEDVDLKRAEPCRACLAKLGT